MREPKSNRNVSVGVIGAGEIASRVHLPTLFAIDNISVAWITDIAPGPAMRAAHAYKIDYVPLPNDLRDIPYTDVVLLAIPYGARTSYFRALSERSTAIYVEKPFARTTAEHRSLCNLFPAHALACGLQRRSWGPTRLIKQFIEDKLFGELRLARCGHGGAGTSPGDGYNADINLAGGGRLLDLGVHGIDMVLFASEATAAEINTVSMITDRDFDLDTVAVLTLTNKNGAKIQFDVAVSSLRNTMNGCEFVFDNAKVLISFSEDPSVKVSALNGKPLYFIEPVSGAYPQTVHQMFYEHWVRFLEGLRSEAPNATSAASSILTTEVIEKMYVGGART